MKSDRAFIERYKDYFGSLHRADLSCLCQFYAEHAVVDGPLRRLRGLVALEEHFLSLTDHLEHCRYEFLDQLVGEHSAYLKWELHFRPARRRTEPCRLRGVSHLKWSERIEYQQDFYDTEPWLREQSPLYDHLVRWLKPRLAS